MSAPAYGCHSCGWHGGRLDEVSNPFGTGRKRTVGVCRHCGQRDRLVDLETLGSTPVQRESVGSDFILVKAKSGRKTHAPPEGEACTETGDPSQMR